MSYRLGIDLGTSSLGWCCLTTENEEPIGILDMGVRVFPDGRNDKSNEPLTVARRDARGARRRLKRFKLRQTQLIADLKSMGLFPTETAELKSLERLNPYELRAKALHQQISLYEIGRVIFHLNQRRGFLSNRKEEKQEKKSKTKTQEAMNELNRLMAENNCKSLGEYMYKTGNYRFKNATDNAGKLIISVYPNREMYQKEFDLIWETQKQYYPNVLTDERKKRLRDFDIFYQRPLKKQETGFCSLEPNERRCPKAFTIAQEFRIRSDIANMELTYPENRLLTKDEREILFEFLNFPQEDIYDNDFIVSFEQIIRELQLPEDCTFNLMANNRKGLLCNMTNAILGDSRAFGTDWKSYSEEKQEQIVNLLQDYSLQQEEIRDSLSEIVPQLSEQNMDTILEQSLLLPDEYANLSAVAMRKLSEDMRLCGTKYKESVKNVYQRNDDDDFKSREELLPKYQELFSEQLIGGDKENFQKQWDYDNYMGRQCSYCA